VGCGWRIFIRLKIAAKRRNDAEGAEEPGADARALHRLCACAGTQCETAVQRIGVNRAKDFIEVLPVDEIKVRQGRSLIAGGRREDAHQTRLVSIGQRLDQRCFDQAENGYRGRDTQGQNECGCAGEAGALAKLTDRVSKILDGVVNPV